MRGLFAVVVGLAVTALACSAADEGDAAGSVVGDVAVSGRGSVRGHPEGVAAEGDDVAARVFVQVEARRAVGAGLEFGLRVNATAMEWLPQERVFDFEAAPTGAWWSSSPAGSGDGGVSAVRVRARRLEDGRVELALLTPSGQEVLPRARFVTPSALAGGGWVATSPVVLSAGGEVASTVSRSTGAVDGFLSVSVGVGYEWDRWSGKLLFGPGHGCGIRAGGQVECWGNDWDGQASPPGGAFVAVDAGWTHTCGIRAVGDVACWGVSWGVPASGPFVAVSAGRAHSCGLRPHGGIECWGDDSLGQSSPPEGTFTALSAGKGHTCALKVGGRVACWGSNTRPSGLERIRSGQAEPPGGEFIGLSAGSHHTCGIRPDGEIECWGYGHEKLSPPHEAEFVAVSAAQESTCGLRADGVVLCWDATRGSRGLLPPGGEFTSFSASDGRGCGIRPGGDSTCWGSSTEHYPKTGIPADTPGGQFQAVTAGKAHTCALELSGTVTCWGAGPLGQPTVGPPQGEFVAIDAGRFGTCGVRVDGEAVCWGRLFGLDWRGRSRDDLPPGYPRVSGPPSGPFAVVSVGGTSACGLRPAGAVSCWGDDDVGQSSPPGGAFRALSAGGRHVCGLRPGGEVACWGDNTLGQTASPEGSFSVLSAGEAHTCGLRSTGEVACWGHTGHLYYVRGYHDVPPTELAPVEPPEGIFSALDAGSFHTCGLRPSGDVECWPSWGVEGNLDDNLTFRAQPVVPALAQNAPAARFTTLQNPAPIETRSGEPLVPDTGTHHACDAGLADRAACQQSPDDDSAPPLDPCDQPRTPAEGLERFPRRAPTRAVRLPRLGLAAHLRYPTRQHHRLLERLRATQPTPGRLTSKAVADKLVRRFASPESLVDPDGFGHEMRAADLDLALAAGQYGTATDAGHRRVLASLAVGEPQQIRLAHGVHEPVDAGPVHGARTHGARLAAGVEGATGDLLGAERAAHPAGQVGLGVADEVAVRHNRVLRLEEHVAGGVYE